jgi:hypothetical protein
MQELGELREPGECMGVAELGAHGRLCVIWGNHEVGLVVGVAP